MNSKKWKITVAFSAIATFFLLWAGLNIWTDRVYWPGGRDVAGDYLEPQFVTHSEPAAFWPIVGFKLITAGMSLLVLGYAHWLWWRRRALQKRTDKRDASP